MTDFVDLHAHVLPGLDDGPEDLAQTLEMLKALEGLGYGNVFATPHHRLYSWDGLDPETVERGVRKVRKAAEEKGIGVRLWPGMEFDLDESLPERAASAPGKGNHLLVDAGFWGVPRGLAALLGQLMDAGTRVLLVHPERNRDLCRDRRLIRTVVASGVRLLGNLGSFSGMYGQRARHDAGDLLKEGLYWAVATDMHAPDQSPWIRDGIGELESLAGPATAQEMMRTRPMEVVRAMEDDL